MRLVVKPLSLGLCPLIFEWKIKKKEVVMTTPIWIAIMWSTLAFLILWIGLMIVTASSNFNMKYALWVVRRQRKKVETVARFNKMINSEIKELEIELRKDIQ